MFLFHHDTFVLPLLNSYNVICKEIGVAELTIGKVPLSFVLGNGVETLIRDPQNMPCIIIAYEANVYGASFIGYFFGGEIAAIKSSSNVSTQDDGHNLCIYTKNRAVYAKINGAGGGLLRVRIISGNSI